MPTHHAVIACVPERSSFNAGLILARTLRDRGHRVTFAGAERADSRDHVQRHGFEFVGIGSAKLAAASVAAGQARNPLVAARRWRLFHAQLLVELDAVARALGPDVAFLDVLATNPAAYLLSSLRTPTFLFHGGMLSARFSSRYPPIWSSMVVPADPVASGLACRTRFVAAWAVARVRRRARLLALRQAWIPALVEARAARHVRRMATRNGWRFCWGDWGPQPVLPEIVLTHRALDWPQLRTGDRCHLSGGQAQRLEYDAGWAGGLDAGRKLIYCVTSTMIQQADVLEPGGPTPRLRRRAMGMKRFLDTVVAAVAGRSDWQLLLACGPFAGVYRASQLPGNVQVCERAPQTQVLQRAAAMITQAGAGALREAASFGVPMLAFPLWTDQFGNSARIVYHGIGERLDFARVTVTEMAAAIERMLEDPSVRAAVSALAAECSRDAEGEVPRFVEFVRRHAALDI